MYCDTNNFLNCIAWFKHADLECLGYDKSITRVDCGFKMALQGEVKSAHVAMANIVSVIYNSNLTIGQLTRIMGLTYQPSPTQTDYLVVKDAFLVRMHPWHLPIQDDQFSVQALLMMDGISGHQVADSLPSILKAMTVDCDIWIHYCTVFHTPVVKCTWFSCRYSLQGHLEACRRGIMYRNISNSNIWFWVPQTNPHGKPHFATLEVPTPWFPKHTGMTRDFGLGLNLLDKDGTANAVTITGTFPFGTMADSNEALHMTHNLELYIFLLWVIDINLKDLYHQVKHWLPPPKIRPILDNSMNNNNSNLISSKLHLPTFNWPGKANLLPHLSGFLQCNILLPNVLMKNLKGGM
ncbi:hypothetical protein DFJ58DRAFT_845900 [Suillus subalutaceus]|uniref:uncharacterized protein n=1 Tax=Suillus subalutaceus TaxID=48586 RepID=UPI001B87445F|nr:uncharacterized protein DFJ58DRAFT_845900 [Suillus subalutaceus]KAG1838857.1 hypothetical protein DFJ58DRAFT_845900 [Suillus subalutaceus]